MYISSYAIHIHKIAHVLPFDVLFYMYMFLFVSLSTMCTLSRALEASIRDNHANMTRLGIPVPSTFVDPLNPHERKRVGSTPVGVKNIGNTCWFSAVIQVLSCSYDMVCSEIAIHAYYTVVYSTCTHTHTHTQSLFHIPVFAELILNYRPPPLPTGATIYPNSVSFVLELQKLFALLLHSERKYINPQPAIQVREMTIDVTST